MNGCAGRCTDRSRDARARTVSRASNARRASNTAVRASGIGSETSASRIVTATLPRNHRTSTESPTMRARWTSPRSASSASSVGLTPLPPPSPPAVPAFTRVNAGTAGGEGGGSGVRPTEEADEALRGLVHRALIVGDSVDVRWLRGRVAVTMRDADVSDPMPDALTAVLDARLALLARDTVRALASLERSVQRPAQPFIVFYPLLSMAPERMLLAELNLARGDTATARRWLDSFSNAWSFGDVLYARRVACVGRALGVPRGSHMHDALAQCRRPSP